MQCMQNLKINYIDATSFANLSLRNTLHFLLYFTQFFVLSLLNALELIAASFVALARKVRIRLRPSTVMTC